MILKTDSKYYFFLCAAAKDVLLGNKYKSFFSLNNFFTKLNNFKKVLLKHFENSNKLRIV
jgi:hypothetical protein